MSKEKLELLGEINQNLEKIDLSIQGLCWILSIVGGILIVAIFKYIVKD